MEIAIKLTYTLCLTMCHMSIMCQWISANKCAWCQFYCVFLDSSTSESRPLHTYICVKSKRVRYDQRSWQTIHVLLVVLWFSSGYTPHMHIIQYCLPAGKSHDYAGARAETLKKMDDCITWIRYQLVMQLIKQEKHIHFVRCIVDRVRTRIT